MPNYDLIVTGAKGNIASRLKEKYSGQIFGIDRDNWSAIDNSAITAKAAIHCAFDLKHSYSQQPQMMVESNILSTAKLLETIKKNKIEKFIFISSCAVYGHSSNTTEKNICVPITVNGQIKLINEYLIQEFCKANNIKFHIFRVFNLFGGDDHFSVISHLMRNIKNKTPFLLNNDGISQRDFIHVDDVCDIIIETAEKDFDFTIMNLGTGKSIQIKQLYDLAKSIVPELNSVQRNSAEIEYSRADLTLFRQYFDKKFINVLESLESELKSLLTNRTF